MNFDLPTKGKFGKGNIPWGKTADIGISSSINYQTSELMGAWEGNSINEFMYGFSNGSVKVPLWLKDKVTSALD
ncbi:hypothetical protein [Photobacterium angustum]|uniref:hypothetical protein n=1 Tax=Photobacterium angustum TaxID=661 RepID=UPI0011B24AE3|nr:hypothetical protein [Photobacterium angustum]